MYTLHTTPEQSEQGLQIVRDELLPWLRGSTGFRGLIRLSDRDSGKTHVITLWADEASRRASEEAGARLTDLTAAAVGAQRIALEDFEVTLFDVD